MENLNREDVLRIVNDKKIKFIRIWFTDILGMLKSFAITAEELEGAFEEGWVLMDPQSKGMLGLKKAIW